MSEEDHRSVAKPYKEDGIFCVAYIMLRRHTLLLLCYLLKFPAQYIISATAVLLVYAWIQDLYFVTRPRLKGAGQRPSL